MNFLKQNTEQRRNLILNGRISTTILLLSLPALMMGLVQSVIPVIDGLFINNIVGTIAASSVSYSGPIVNMIGALAQGLSVAGMAVIGQSIGQGDMEEARHVSTQMIVCAFLFGFILAPILIIVAFPVSMNIHADISHDVFIYLILNALVLPFSFMESIYNAIKNASGKPEATFTRMLLMLVLKIIFNALFISIFAGVSVGAVMASLAANMLITAWMYYELFIATGCR